MGRFYGVNIYTDVRGFVPQSTLSFTGNPPRSLSSYVLGTHERPGGYGVSGLPVLHARTKRSPGSSPVTPREKVWSGTDRGGVVCARRTRVSGPQMF